MKKIVLYKKISEGKPTDNEEEMMEQIRAKGLFDKVWGKEFKAEIEDA